jgi:outer membrane protein OmpA-like peptidoglycan-associated protein
MHYREQGGSVKVGFQGELDVTARQKQEAEQAKAEAIAQQPALAVEADRARQAAAQSDLARQQAEKEKQELRARLLQQLNTVLSTRDSARGLIANMSDVLFKSGSFDCEPPRVSVWPNSVGSDEYNRQVSERRAQAVRDYLVQQGISPDAVAAGGFGKSEPVASNDTPEGRQQNRRVELVLTGDAIGSLTGIDSATTASTGQRQRGKPWSWCGRAQPESIPFAIPPGG